MSNEHDRAIEDVDDSIFDFMRTRPLHPLTQKLMPQIKSNLAHFGSPFVIAGETNQRFEAAEHVIDALNEEKKNV